MSCFVPQPLMWYARMHVRRELVAQADPLLRERRAERDRVRLLEVAPEVGLDVHDDGLRPVHALEEQADVLPVRLHHLRVAQMREVGLRLVAALRIRLQQHVVRQHRDRRRATTSPARTSTRTCRRDSTSTSPARCSRRRRGTGSGSRTARDARSAAAPPGASVSPICSVFGQPCGSGGSLADALGANASAASAASAATRSTMSSHSSASAISAACRSAADGRRARAVRSRTASCRRARQARAARDS